MCEVRRSNISGNGVFASQKFQKGNSITKFSKDLIEIRNGDDYTYTGNEILKDDTDYRFQLSDDFNSW